MGYDLLREAFKRVFHNAGELWFGGEDDDWWDEWCDFLGALGINTSTDEHRQACPHYSRHGG